MDYWLERILGYTLKAEEIDRTNLIRVSFGTRELGNEIRPKNVGTGVSYMAEVLIGALSCRSGDVLIIENPEIHLHPSDSQNLCYFYHFWQKKVFRLL